MVYRYYLNILSDITYNLPSYTEDSQARYRSMGKYNNRGLRVASVYDLMTQ